jgi:hypothetical protein
MRTIVKANAVETGNVIKGNQAGEEGGDEALQLAAVRANLHLPAERMS